MTDDEQLNRLLDLWESWMSSGLGSSLDTFIKSNCPNAPTGVLARLRQQVHRLGAADQCLDAFGISPEPAPTETISSLKPGFVPLPNYRLESRLGRGGFGEVWRASAPGGFHVALKFVRLNSAIGDTELRSLQVIKDVRHPHLLSVSGAWQQNDWLIIAMELADGTLEQRHRDYKSQGSPGIPYDELIRYLTEAAEGLDYLNEPRQSNGDGLRHGIQHRDVKPQNLLLVGGSLKVGDFGLARVLEHGQASHTGSLTYAYAAPEFFTGQTSSQSDQYSLAVTYCYLRGGRLPFNGERGKLMMGHLNKAPDLSMLPPEERPVVAKALAKKPTERWKSCGEFVSQLRAAHAAPLRHPFWTTLKQTSRRPSSILTIGVVVIALLLLASFGSRLFRGTVADSSRAAEVQTPVEFTITVLDFENHAKDPAFDGFRLGLRDMLVTDLAQVGGLRITERARLNEVLEEHKLAKGDFIDPNSANPTGKGLATQVLLTGGFLISGDDVRVDLRMVSVATGAVLLADSVIAKKGEFASVPRAMTEKIVVGLNLPLSEQERGKFGRAASKDFEAFRLYSEAELAKQNQQQAEASRLFQEALTRDPQFGLAKRGLASIEAAPLLQASDSDKERLRKLGSIGQALRDHHDRQLAIASQSDRTPAYFASLILLSAHAGLLGDHQRELELLMYYWQEFAATVPVADAFRVGEEVNRILAVEGKFFQERVDNGVYSFVVDEDLAAQKYLKTELRGELSWPKFAVIWPFSPDLRSAFQNTQAHPTMKIAQEFFEESLPHLPHDHLREVMWSYSTGNSPESLRQQVAIAGYYAQAPKLSGKALASIVEIQKALLDRLDRTDFASLAAEERATIIATLEVLSTGALDSEVRSRSKPLAARFALTAPSDSPKPATDVGVANNALPTDAKFCTLPLTGSRMLFVLDLSDDVDVFLLPYLQRQLSETIALLPPNVKFDIVLTGCLKNGAKASPFDGPQPATNDSRRTALEFVKGIRDSRDLLGHATPRSLTELFSKVLLEWPQDNSESGVLVVVCVGTMPSIPQELTTSLDADKHPQIHFVGDRKVSSIGKLVQRSGGAAVVLEEGELTEMIPKRWDVSGIK